VFSSRSAGRGRRKQESLDSYLLGSVERLDTVRPLQSGECSFCINVRNVLILYISWTTGRSSSAMRSMRAQEHGIKLQFIRPGKPVRNVHIESVKGRLREECLYWHAFVSLGDARKRIEALRTDYGSVRPHSGLGNCRRINSGNSINRLPASPLTYEWCTRRSQVTTARLMVLISVHSDFVRGSNGGPAGGHGVAAVVNGAPTLRLGKPRLLARRTKADVGQERPYGQSV